MKMKIEYNIRQSIFVLHTKRIQHGEKISPHPTTHDMGVADG